MYRPKAITRRVVLLLFIVVILNVTVFFHEPTKQYVIAAYNDAAKQYGPKIISNSFANSKIEKTSVSDSFFKTLFLEIEKAAPIERSFNWDDIKGEGCDMGDVGFETEDRDARLSYENLAHCLKLPEENFESLKKGHASFVKYLDSIDDSEGYLSQVFPSGKGIVTVGGGRYSLLSYLMIRMVREKGGTLPIEVVIPPGDEPEDEFCREILAYNAKCVFFKDRLPESVVSKTTFKSYQVKSIALLISSFQEIVFIDSDNMPLKNIDDAFSYEVYKDHGMVTWPDFWRRLTSPEYYKLADIPIDFKERVRNGGDEISPVSRYDDLKKTEQENQAKIPMHDFKGTVADPTTESGQMLVNKKNHLRTLILATYYNVYGNDYYYQLFSQGTAGQGDKETFVFAASKMKEPFYQVKIPFALAGYNDPRETKSGFQGSALLQHDPEQDYKFWNSLKEEVISEDSKFSTYDENYSLKRDFYTNGIRKAGNAPREYLFLHASYHKYDPWNLYNEKSLVHSDGKHFRAHPCASASFKGFDVELFLWEILNTALCSDKVVSFTYTKNLQKDEKNYKPVCKYVSNRLEHLRDTHEEFVSYFTSADTDGKKCVDISRGH